ncbi:MAG: 23S rRNA (guanosine(2251)-2'-O)-methyltransferase RlmB [Gammaproteobacteria bacterium]
MSKIEYVYGLHAAEHLLARAPEQVLEAWLQQGQQKSQRQLIEQQLQQHGIRMQSVPVATLDKLSEGAVHQGVVLRCRAAAALEGLDELLPQLSALPLLLVLDGVQDPHNLGACMRAAAAAGADAVIIPKDRAVGLTATARKAASGAAEYIPLVRVTNLARALAQLQEAGVWLVGCSGDTGTDLYDIDMRGPIALVLGAEGHGLRRLTRESCDYLARIPMSGLVESLNVSVAAGVCLFEVRRQRRPVQAGCQPQQ